jgi:hypothetical protein
VVIIVPVGVSVNNSPLEEFYLLALLATCFHAGFLLGLFFDHEDGGDMFL